MGVTIGRGEGEKRKEGEGELKTFMRRDKVYINSTSPLYLCVLNLSKKKFYISIHKYILPGLVVDPVLSLFVDLI